MSELVLYTRRGPAAVITINRPDKRNALNRPIINGLDVAFARADKDATVRCVVLAGAGPTFCAGMDLAELQSTMTAHRDEIWQDALKLAQVFERIYTLPKPTIALVQGPAVAGGCGLVSVCDLAIATPEARFGYPEVRRGLVAALVMPHLLRHVGERLARYLLLTGDVIDAPDALAAGLINEVVSADRMWARADVLIAAIAEGGPQALAATKKLLQRYSLHALSVEESAKESAAPRLTDECRQGLSAFFDKKLPPWHAAT
jgi:methylglutaconyl-CoA hydratase